MTFRTTSKAECRTVVQVPRLLQFGQGDGLPCCKNNLSILVKEKKKQLKLGYREAIYLDSSCQLYPLLHETASTEPKGHNNCDNPLLRLLNAPNKNFAILNDASKTGSAWRF